MCRNSKKKRLENRTNFYQKFLKKTSEISEKNLKSEQSEKIVYWEMPNFPHLKRMHAVHL